MNAGISISEIDAVAFTRGPGLLGSLLVGASFAKGFALAQNIPLIAVNHLQGHVLAHFVKDDINQTHPSFPFLCLLVSGGHTQLIVVRDYLDMKIVGETIDDAAGEAFDKCAKVMGLPYPGGPVIDQLSRIGDANTFQFAKPNIKELDFSFSGLKTSFLYTLRDKMSENPNFIEERKADLCASLQHTIISILLSKIEMAAKKYGINEVAIAGGVSANSGLRDGLVELGNKKGWHIYLPQFRYTTDNAAMIAITGYYRFLAGDLSPHSVTPLARFPINPEL
jgi:N6-L-threonylcarbamoyladenine synthase